MGWISDVGQKIRQFWAQDKEQLAIQMAKGKTSSGFPVSGYDLLQAYGYDVLSDYLRMEHDLLSRFVDYEEMDDYPELSASIDIYADDSTVLDTPKNRCLWITSQDKSVEQNLDDLFRKKLRYEEEAWEISRTLCKYGNDYEEILVTDQGVQGLNFLAPATVRRIEGPRGELFGFIQDYKGRFGFSPDEFKQIMTQRMANIGLGMQGGGNLATGGQAKLDKVSALEDWEVVHMRLRGKHRRSLYGYSVLEPARWIWKRLMLLEDAALIYRLQRAPERYAFYVDVGDLPPQEALAYVNKVRQQFKKKKFYNPSTGKLDLKFEPLSMDEDFFIPVRKGTESTRVEVLGSPSWQHMDDVEYFRDKLFAAIKIPKAYLAQEEGVARAVLSSEDVRFARTILRVQNELKSGASKIARVHLASLGIDPARVDFQVNMTVPSAIFELAQLEARNAKADLAMRMREFVSLHWVLSNIFNMNDVEIEEITKERSEDALRTSNDEAEGQKLLMKAQGMAPGAGGGGGFGASREHKQELSLVEGRGRNGARPKRSNGNGISEQELFAGDRDGEKRAEDKLDKLLLHDRHMTRRLKEIGGLLSDLRSVSASR